MSGSLFGRRDDGQDTDGELEEHSRRQVHQNTLAQMHQEDTVPNKEYLNELTRNEIDDDTLYLMQDLMTQDYVLSNLLDAEVNEIKHIARSISRKIKRMHPPEQSYIQGVVRKVDLDDEHDGLSSLSPFEETLIDQAVLAFFTRLSRSRSGWQQDEISKQVRVSKTEDNEQSESTGLFGGLRR